MAKEVVAEGIGKNDGLAFLLDQSLAASGADKIEIWEGQLKTELLSLPSDLRLSVEKYVEIIIGGSRIRALNPAEYAERIIQANQGLPPTWRFLSESVSRLHKQMLTESQGNDDDDEARTSAEALKISFEQLIQSAGIRHERIMGKTMGHLIEKFKRYPGEI